MRKQKIYTFFSILFILIVACNVAFGQIDTSKIIVDDIQFDLKEVKIYPNKDTVEVSLFLISYAEHPREFRMNNFASQLYDEEDKGYFFDALQMENVRILFASRENYLNYLLQNNTPVELKIRYPFDRKSNRPEYTKLVFQENSNEGRFLEVEIPLQSEGNETEQ